MAKIVYRQMPAPRELSQQIPPGQKVGCKSPWMGANFWSKSPAVRGGMVMDEIDTCIKTCFDKILEKLSNQGVAAALFSSRRLNNFENEKKYPLLGSLLWGVNFRSRRTILVIITTPF